MCMFLILSSSQKRTNDFHEPLSDQKRTLNTRYLLLPSDNMYEIIWLVNCGRVKVENLGLNKPQPGFIPFDWVELDESWVEGDRRGGQMHYLPPVFPLISPATMSY